MTPIEIPSIAKDVNKLWEWIFRLLFLVGFLWSQTTYVGKKEFEEYKKTAEKTVTETAQGIIAINSTLTRIDEKMKNDQRQDESLKDHETRIRVLEKP